MLAAGPRLSFDDLTSLTVQIYFPRSRLAVAKIESVGADLAPFERPYLA